MVGTTYEPPSHDFDGFSDDIEELISEIPF